MKNFLSGKQKLARAGEVGNVRHSRAMVPISNQYESIYKRVNQLMSGTVVGEEAMVIWGVSMIYGGVIELGLYKRTI